MMDCGQAAPLSLFAQGTREDVALRIGAVCWWPRGGRSLLRHHGQNDRAGWADGTQHLVAESATRSVSPLPARLCLCHLHDLHPQVESTGLKWPSLVYQRAIWIFFSVFEGVPSKTRSDTLRE